MAGLLTSFAALTTLNLNLNYNKISGPKAQSMCQLLEVLHLDTAGTLKLRNIYMTDL